ncbi:MAG: hypothetical protein EA368_15390 [Leptolyngbya sp. DLM2.Bin27]|nr:MAG: hypothetical protein EA368_15390 [Leptolyngbya sp. DLM2.Bin27]
MDLQSIQSKLIQTVNALNQSDTDVRVDWAGGPQLPAVPLRPAPQPRASVDFAAAVDVLQRRAESAHAYASSARASIDPLNPATVPAQIYLKRLSAMADRVNHLSAEQERAIAEMQTLQARLAQLRPGFVPQGQPHRAYPNLDISRAALAAAEVDPQGNVLLGYRAITPTMTASAPAAVGRSHGDLLAEHLRATYGPPAAQGGRSSPINDVLALGQEPLQLLSSLGRTAQSLIPELTRFSSRRPAATTAGNPLNQGGQLSLVDSVLWFGGGVIGRLVLTSLLTMFSALWPVALAAITAITAYALYRATLAPKLAFGPAIRVFLLVVGLVVGGQL